MYISTLLSLSTTLAVGASIPHHPLRRAVPSIPNNTTFDILLAGTMNDAMGTLAETVDVMILDLEGNDASTIADLKSQGHTVLCYFSAGTYEPGRAASGQFKDGDMGNYMKDWPDERWLNVDSENVRKIMTGRMQMAQEKGCVGVDLDNVDGYQPDNNDGFSKPASAHAAYVKFLAGEAASRGLATGLKNALELIPDVVDVVQFAVNEQCHEFGECDKYKPFTEQGKAVFNIEYSAQCGDVDGVKMSSVKKDLDLNSLGGQCGGGSGNGEAQKPAPSKEATKPTPTKAPAKPTSTKEPAVPVTTTAAPAPPKPTATQTSPAKPTKSGAPSAPKPTPSKPAEEDGDDEDDEDEEDDEQPQGRPRWRGWWFHN